MHCSAVQGERYRTLEEGAEVEFEVEQEAKGPRAARVVVIRAPEGGGQSGGESW